MVIEEQDSDYEDNEIETETLVGSDGDKEDNSSDPGENKTEEDSEVSELSSQHDINIIQSRKALSNNVCYEFLNKGKCTIAGCIYNHDPVAVEKFRTIYKSKSFSKPKVATTPGKRRA
jgi:hypothetical protein